MSYVIMTSKEIHSGQWVSLEKSGNEYVVVFYSKKTACVSKHFTTNWAAKEIVQKFLDAFMTGDYSEEVRASWLN